MPFPRLVRTKEPNESALGERSDDELMALTRAGMRSAFATLVGRHAERVVRTCCRFVNDPQLGSELAQDIWVLVWQGRDKYQADGSFIPWLVTVARNHCRNELRRAKIVVAKDGIDTLAEDASPAAGALDSLLVEERRSRVRSALAQLPAQLREALLLRYAEELCYDEMTGVLGAGESTLRSRVHHGLKALKLKLEEES